TPSDIQRSAATQIWGCYSKGIGRSGGVLDGGVLDGLAGSGGDDTGKGGDTGSGDSIGGGGGEGI
ncbi:hypothetical protein Tco_0693688, partial [Tanacetum coccineum]